MKEPTKEQRLANSMDIETMTRNEESRQEEAKENEHHYSPETAQQVRELISSIKVNELNFNHIARYGKINGSLHADLYDLFYRHFTELQSLRDQLAAKEKELECHKADSDPSGFLLKRFRAKDKEIAELRDQLKQQENTALKDIANLLEETNIQNDEIKELKEALKVCLDELMYASTTGDLWMWAKSNEAVPERLVKIRKLIE